MSFHSIYAHGFARVAACVTTSHVADPTANAKAILAAAGACHEQSVAVAVFPELCLSGYAIEDLVKQDNTEADQSARANKAPVNVSSDDALR